jgi:hypothetical protein
MTSFVVPAGAGEDAAFDDVRLHLAAAASLARFKGLSREHTDSDLRAFLTWCRQPLATLHRELGLIRHPRDQRSRLLDERLDVFRFKRRVMGGRIGPDLADPHGLGFVGSADEVLDTA